MKNAQLVKSNALIPRRWWKIILSKGHGTSDTQFLRIFRLGFVVENLDT